MGSFSGKWLEGKKNHCGVIRPILQLKKLHLILKSSLRLDLSFLVLVTPELFLRAIQTCSRTCVRTHARTHTNTCSHMQLQRTTLKKATGGRPWRGRNHPLVCRVSLTSVTASMEAPVFSSSSMTRIWFFLQAMCKGVKPFCSPTQRERDKQELTYQPKEHPDHLAD